MTVPSDPNLTKQPSTLDSRVEIPADAPRAQGHTDDGAAELQDANAEFKQTVEAEANQPEVGPREPGDHAGSQDEAPDGTIEEVKAWVGDDHDRAQRALEAERAGQSRTTLITYLEAI
jgi:hypothetical protein